MRREASEPSAQPPSPCLKEPLLFLLVRIHKLLHPPAGGVRVNMFHSRPLGDPKASREHITSSSQLLPSPEPRPAHMGEPVESNLDPQHWSLASGDRSSRVHPNSVTKAATKSRELPKCRAYFTISAPLHLPRPHAYSNRLSPVPQNLLQSFKMSVPGTTTGLSILTKFRRDSEVKPTHGVPLLQPPHFPVLQLVTM